MLRAGGAVDYSFSLSRLDADPVSPPYRVLLIVPAMGSETILLLEDQESLRVLTNLISFIYVALPSHYHMKPDWQEAAVHREYLRHSIPERVDASGC
jgi:hypothetical protein